MLKMKKHVLGLTCMLLSFTLLFGACSGSNNKSPSSEKNTPASGQHSSQPSATEGKKPLPANPLKLSWMLEDNPNQPILSNTPVTREILSRMNVQLQLESVPTSNYVERKNALIATNNIPDMLTVDLNDIQMFARTGIFLNISDYLHLAPNFQKAIEDREEMKKMLVDGKLYAFPTLEYYRVAVAPQPLMRVDLLKELNLEEPRTFDELFDVLLAFKEAYPESIPFVGSRRGTLYMLGQLAYPMGAGGFQGFSTSGMYFEPREGRYVFGPTSENYKDVVAYLNKLYSHKLLDPDYSVNTQQMAVEKLSSGRSFFTYDNNTHAVRLFNPAIAEIDPKAKFDIIGPLQNQYGETRSLRYEQDWLGTSTAISSKVKDPEAAVRFMDWMYSEEGMLVTNFGIEGETYEMRDGKPYILQSILDDHKDQQDVFSATQSTLGVGYLTFAKYVHEGTLADISEDLLIDMSERIDRLTEEGTIQFMGNNPPFTEEESEALRRLEIQVTTIFEQGVDRFIMGTRPMSEWGAFRQQMLDAGVAEIEKIYNDALSRL
ncbi:extracellular solute-binding protein [Paenibacillus sp. J5C_2022]|uniref:extracellular solute-binding protein n=1 Tax=Paenibacillus sp. J5C2022 TaxID=2977129 RepID=UPI0021D17899|nr:extracellular solute-binding protein [Paenibacillus sp. J5C2022]MCU6711426.1 extracellular solute-binding protein [Paenibacillus sp. J5C2022]